MAMMAATKIENQVVRSFIRWIDWHGAQSGGSIAGCVCHVFRIWISAFPPFLSRRRVDSSLEFLIWGLRNYKAYLDAGMESDFVPSYGVYCLHP